MQGWADVPPHEAGALQNRREPMGHGWRLFDIDLGDGVELGDFRMS